MTPPILAALVLLGACASTPESPAPPARPGPVLSPTGARLARFMSTPRLETEGWRVVFDKSDGD